jgi:hypothetical protein
MKSLPLKMLTFFLLSFTATALWAEKMNPQQVAAQARQGQARVALNEIAMAQAVFHIDHELYTSDLKKLEISNTEKSFYKVGFIEASKEKVDGVNPQNFNSDALKWNYDSSFGIDKLKWAEAKKHCKDCVAQKSKFKAIAIGYIPKLDVWTIDQDKKLQHVIDGSK